LFCRAAGGWGGGGGGGEAGDEAAAAAGPNVELDAHGVGELPVVVGAEEHLITAVKLERKVALRTSAWLASFRRRGGRRETTRTCGS
jgi:hypothetical protein